MVNKHHVFLGGLCALLVAEQTVACGTPNVGYYELDASGTAWVIAAEWCDEQASTAPLASDEFAVSEGWPGGGGGGGGGHIQADPIGTDAIHSGVVVEPGSGEVILSDLPVLPRMVSEGVPRSFRITLRRVPNVGLRARPALRPPEQHEINESDTAFDCQDEYDLRRAAVQRLGPAMQPGDTVTFRFAFGRARPGRQYEFDVYQYSHFGAGGLSLYLVASSCFA
jgi:hypothetical protein